MSAVVLAPRRPVAWVILGCGVVASLHLGKAAIATPMLQTDLGVSLGQVGWLTGIFAVLGLLGGAPAGAVAAALGGQRTLLLGLGITAFAGAAGGLAASFAVLVVSRLLEGLGFLLIIVGGPAILERLMTGAARDKAFALWSCFMPLGMALVMVVGPLFPGWQSLWWSSAALAVLAATMVVYCIPQDASLGLSSRVIGDVRHVLRSRATTLLAIVFALYSLMFFALFSFLPVLLMERMDVGYRSAGLLSALASAVNAGGNLAAGYLLGRGAGRGPLLIFASAVMGACGLGIFLGLFEAPTTFLLCLLFSTVGGLIPATLLASAPLTVREATLVPIAVGLIMQGSNLGQLLGPVAVGSVTTAFGWSAAGVVVLLAAMAACATALFLRAALESGAPAAARRPTVAPAAKRGMR
ncbi:MFS transporter [Pseudomonas songnenensis]|uniref:MFS transporter n=1 Tax=Pseudomonas songnenensis TaxID=1176259 RepID=A0ABX9UP15_9PSED|nr:MFS transporter [Pseudomonas songnenensis]MCQ4299468.1 MFS transporter [Pseudomonas songnenensis]RMH94345.1 MFS transporter [Pseudomonas songnenensis]